MVMPMMMIWGQMQGKWLLTAFVKNSAKNFARTMIHQLDDNDDYDDDNANDDNDDDDDV